MSRGHPRTAIGVIGGGRWGITLAHTAASRGHAVRLYCEDARLTGQLNSRRISRKVVPELERLHDGVQVTTHLAEVCGKCDLLLLACGVPELRPLVSVLGEHVDGAHAVVHAIRGREPDSLASPSWVLRHETCVRQVGALLGPVQVDALLAGHPGAAVVASPFPAVIKATQRALAGDSLRVYGSRDLAGVEAAASAAAVLAMAIGVALELNLGATTLATLTVRGGAEMARVCVAAGGKAETAFGLAGLGDLLVRRETESREVKAGRMLAQGRDEAAIRKALGDLDAIDGAHGFCAIPGVEVVEARIVGTIDDMLRGRLDVSGALERLMGLAQMAE